MGKNEKPEGESLEALLSHTTCRIALAINGGKKSKYVVKWALEKFVPEGEVYFKVLHVRHPVTSIPTPMGNTIPITQVREDVATAFREEVRWQTNEKLLPYKALCAQKKVQAEVLQIESDDIASAIAEEITKCNISTLVIGASFYSMFARGPSLSSQISESAPSFCTVYAVSKGKLSSVRPSSSEKNGNTRDDTVDSEASFSTSTSSSQMYSSFTEETGRASSATYSHFPSPSLPMQRFEALSTINQTLVRNNRNSNDNIHLRDLSHGTEEAEDDASSSRSSSKDTNSPASSFRSLIADNRSWTTDQASTSDAQSDYSSASQVNVNFELEKLRTELRHVRGMYAMAQSEAIDASRKLKDLRRRRLEEAIKLEEISLKEEEAKEVAKQEKEKYESAKREAEYAKECAEREAAQRKEAENKALREAKEKEKLENVLEGNVHQYQEFTWQEIVTATSSLSADLKVGMGAYGTVYKCSLHHTTAAVKVLHSKEAHRSKQFQQELEVLSNIRHPHLLILLGACRDHGCLVYEYMENGSLEERLLRKKGAPPLPWFDRYRIAWEVAAALVFLHNSKPRPIIHRDLKPANILLDHNLVSKIGDVGLSTMVNSDPSLVSTTYKETGPVGTLCYIDPEYQRTGLVSPKSDVYAFGMVILQLLTAKSAVALAHMVEMAIENDQLTDILDPEAGKWPIEESKELAILGLKCTELRRRDRPDLRDQVIPVLERLKQVADQARDLALSSRPPPPSHFICPILKDVMREPCVAADGYTYDRKAIEVWLQENDNSPMTNLPLPHKHLLPNFTLLSAIMEWKSQSY